MASGLIDVGNLRQKLKEFDFRGLFIEELGWDHHHAQPLSVVVNESTFRLSAVAEKRGMVAYICEPDGSGAAPEYASRRKIEKQVARTTHEHIIIYVDGGQNTQTWQWVKRELGRPTACREHTFHRSQPGDALIQKLQAIAFDLEEEERLTIAEVAGRARQAFDVDRVTKRFYERFKDEHAAFLGFIKGITVVADREWYASLMLNRLMFIYFIQKKGFLDWDTDYLRHRLQMMRERKGKDQFLTFYRHFLLRLFHEGLGKEEKSRSTEMDTLLGRVPYLNGGLFDEHQLEKDNKAIEVPDEAFERLFNFFDAYQWHLDERPLRAGNEINPDVLGYIFEKYINQKQMGAYYTKEDITEYISKNTVIPFLFDAAEKECAIAFRLESAMWRLLQDDPDRYIYEAVRKGVDIPLPEDIAAGITDVSKRGGWNRPADEAFALPTETWREHVARRTRCLELRDRLAAGEIHAINDLITYNLNIRQFAQDAIENCEGLELLRAFYRAIEKVTILDPTCGSGAFLFAALNILEPLYQACLDRMQAFVDDLERSGEAHRPEKFSDFRKVLQLANDTKKHPNHRYFVLKSIVLNNLYGVDIMEEAVEICKLRLFLKLVAQVELPGGRPPGVRPPVVPLRKGDGGPPSPISVAKGDGIEPLPDIDFNIRAGNTLVGFTSLEAVRQAMIVMPNGQSRMPSDEDQATLKKVDEDAEMADWAFQEFRESQSGRDMDAGDFATGKEMVRDSLGKLRDQLNRYLAAEYGVDSKDTTAYAKWRSNHQPFHWFVEFYGVMKGGGFDVIIGNPPYVDYDKVKTTYRIEGFSTEPCGDLFAYIIERSAKLLNRQGRCGFIVRLSSIATPRMKSLREVILGCHRTLHFSSFSASDQPSNLFEGVRDRLSIYLMSNNRQNSQVYTSNFLKWFTQERAYLFHSIVCYEEDDQKDLTTFVPKIGIRLAKRIYRKMEDFKNLSHFVSPKGERILYYHESPVHWHKAWSLVPYYFLEGQGQIQSISLRELRFNDERTLKAMLCIANSSVFYWYFNTISDCRHLTWTTYQRLPVGFDKLNEHIFNSLTMLADRLEKDYAANKKLYVRLSKKTGRSEFDSYYPAKSKPIIDEIDRILAKHYGFTEEELDFIINYDIKYRMGKETETEGD